MAGEPLTLNPETPFTVTTGETTYLFWLFSFVP